MIMSMKKFGFSPKRTSSSFIAHYPSPSRFALPPAPSRSLSDSVMIQILEVAEPVIVKWDPESSTYAKVTSLFYDNRQEALEFIKLVNTLHKAMHSLVAENSSSNLLVRAQHLMQIAMKRLEKEFYQILSLNRALLDPEAVSTRSSQTSTRSSLSDFADESDDEVRVAGELISEVEDTAEAIMADLKLIAECMISSGYGKECVLDMYTAIASRWQEIVSVFSYPSTSSVVNQVLNSLTKLAELVRSDLTEFKTLLNKESLKTTVADAGVHMFTVETMNCLSLLADYSVLPDILIDSRPPEKCVMPETFFDGSYSDSSPSPSVSARVAWLVFVLVCKLDGKAKHYKDVSQSYIFLANNLQHILSKVRSSNLRYLLGDDSITMREIEVKKFAASYERLAWSHVIDSVPKNASAMTREEARDSFRKINAVFEEAHHKQLAVVIPDGKLRDEIKVSVARKLLSAYKEFYNAQRVEMEKDRKFAGVVKYAPEDMGNALSDLFFGSGTSSGSVSSSTSSSSSKSRKLLSR
ncbi:hypothetical protein L1887_09469 [Cichorium endivia]|nr:hypothetical protein L1887_09469 [Cichorium endivia]